MKPRDLPNLISLLRLLAVVPIVFLLLERQFTWALVLFAVAGISDGLDGFLARRYGWHTRLGGILDPLADKVLLVTSFLVLGTMGLIPAWLVAAAVLRDLVILSGAIVYHFQVAKVEAAPTFASKLNTALQILLVVSVVADAELVELPAGLIDALVYACLLSILVSGVQYVWIWTGRALVKWHSR